MKIAALDMGSNTTLMLICDVVDGAITKVYSDHSTVTRLGQDIDKTGQLHAEALARMDQCLGLYRDLMNQENVEKVVAVATSAARDANNKDDFFKITSKYNIPVKIIPGAEEARVTFQGSTFDLEDKEGVAVIDVGGGSTEIIADAGGSIRGFSLDVGSVRLTERFISKHPVAQKERAQLESYLSKTFIDHKQDLPDPQKIKKAIAVAGTPTTIAMLDQEIPFQEEKVHGYKLKFADLERWYSKLAEMTVEERQELQGMNPKRADVIVAGTSILMASAKYLNLNELIVSTKGVRYGLALLHDSL